MEGKPLMQGRDDNSIGDLAALDRDVRMWMAEPHKYFKAFSRTARRFQRMHRSPRYRIMTLVGTAAEFLSRRPLRVHVLRNTSPVRTWADVFSVVVSEVVAAKPYLVRELYARGMLPWMVNGNPADDIVDAFDAGTVSLQVESVEAAFEATQWIALMADVKLNEVIVQVDSFTDEEWRVREGEIEAKRAEEKRVLKEIDLARKQWAEAHGEDSQRAANSEKATIW